jgi:hypothetical protein
VGYGGTGTVSIGDAELLPRCCGRITSLRYHKVPSAQNAPLMNFPPKYYLTIILCSKISHLFFPTSSSLTSSRETFLALQTWLADCRALASPDIVILLVGNKSDVSKATSSLSADLRSFAGYGGDGYIEYAGKLILGIMAVRLAVSQGERGRFLLRRLGDGLRGRGLGFWNVVLWMGRMSKRHF